MATHRRAASPVLRAAFATAAPALLLAGALLAARGAPPAPVAESTAVAALEWEPGRVGATTAMFLPLKGDLPKDVRPVEEAVDPRYARIRWGEGPGLLFAVDVAPGKERLWVDADLDGDLADEARTTWPAAGTAGWREETVRVLYRVPGSAPESAEVTIRLSRGAEYAPDRVQIVPMVHRLGRVVLAGRLRTVALVDDNADLRFDDPERDRVYVDLDGDGGLSAGLGGPEQVRIGAPFRVRNEGWRAEVPGPSGREVRFVRLPEAPPAPPRAWPRGVAVPAGQPQTPPAEPFEDLARRFEADRKLDYAARYEIVAKIGRVGTPAAFDLLHAAATSDPNASIQSAAARAMGNPAFLDHGGGRVVELATSKGVNGSVSAGAIDALHGMGHPDRVRVWRDLLGTSGDASVVGAAARHLAEEGGDAGREAVLAAWRRKPADAVRYQVYWALRSFPDGPPPAVMQEAAADPYTSLAAQAVRDLLTVGHPGAREAALALAARRPIVEYLAKAAAEVLGTFGDAGSVAALLALAAEAPAAVAVEVARSLAPVRDPGGIGALLEGLGDRAPVIREMAAQILAGISEPRVTEALLGRARREKDESVLAAVLEALGDHPDARSVDLLLEQGKRRKDIVRQAAIRALARVGMGEEKVRAYFVGLLASREWEDRILALDAAAASADPSLCRKVLPNLAHERRQVRLAASQALERLRCPEAIPALIDALEKEEEGRVVDAIARALYRLTGMHLYDDPATWRKWWTAEGAGFVPPTKVPDEPPAEAGGTRAGFYGIPVRSGRVIFVIDQSGSMSAEDHGPVATGTQGGNRLDVAVREAIAAIKGLKDKDLVNVILFHTTVHPWRDSLQRLTRENRRDLEANLLAQKPIGGTNLFDALELALLDPEVDTVFLLSDGMPGLGRFVATEDIVRAARRLNQIRRVTIHGVSIGRDSDLIQCLVEETGGQYVRR